MYKIDYFKNLPRIAWIYQLLFLLHSSLHNLGFDHMAIHMLQSLVLLLFLVSISPANYWTPGTTEMDVDGRFSITDWNIETKPIRLSFALKAGIEDIEETFENG